MSLPTVVSPFDLDGALEHEVGRELLAMLTGLPAPLVVPLLRYVGHFRPARQQLGFGRALRLVREVLALLPEQLDLQLIVLTDASRQVDRIGARGARKPLGNHRQLQLCIAQAKTPQPSARNSSGGSSGYGTLSSCAANAEGPKESGGTDTSTGEKGE